MKGDYSNITNQPEIQLDPYNPEINYKCKSCGWIRSLKTKCEVCGNSLINEATIKNTETKKINKMTYKELKEFLATLTEEQLNQKVVVFRGDEEEGEFIDSWDVTPEDIYWTDDGDCCGTLDVAKESAKYEGIEWEEAVKDLIVVPAGQVSLYIVTENPKL